jgi:hypothetical protein
MEVAPKGGLGVHEICDGVSHLITGEHASIGSNALENSGEL